MESICGADYSNCGYSKKNNNKYKLYIYKWVWIKCENKYARNDKKVIEARAYIYLNFIEKEVKEIKKIMKEETMKVLTKYLPEKLPHGKILGKVKLSLWEYDKAVR